MKYILLVSIIFSLIGCMQDNDIPERVSLPILVPQYEFKEPNYDSMCIIGKQYTLYPYFYDKNNPYGEQPAKVTVVAKRGGFVQYCYTNEYKKRGATLFHRSCGEFISRTVSPSK